MRPTPEAKALTLRNRAWARAVSVRRPSLLRSRVPQRGGASEGRMQAPCTPTGPRAAWRLRVPGPAAGAGALVPHAAERGGPGEARSPGVPANLQATLRKRVFSRLRVTEDTVQE